MHAAVVAHAACVAARLLWSVVSGVERGGDGCHGLDVSIDVSRRNMLEVRFLLIRILSRGPALHTTARSRAG